MTATLLISRDGPVARVFLNRPDVRNAFNDGVIAELTAAFTGFAADVRSRGLLAGRIRVAPDFDAPLTAAVVEAFEGNV